MGLSQNHEAAQGRWLERGPPTGPAFAPRDGLGGSDQEAQTTASRPIYGPTDHRGHVWTWDFVHDVTMRGGKLRMLNVIDEYTRECLCIHVDRRINADKVQRILALLMAEHGAPGFIRSDNGSEFIEKKLRAWIDEAGIKTLYIDPGSPWQNGFIESFNARLREECLNREILYTLTEARVVIEDWRFKYNHIRPHRSLGYITPIQFAQQEIQTLNPGMGYVRPTASLRPCLDFLNHLYHQINPARLTNALAQFA